MIGVWGSWECFLWRFFLERNLSWIAGWILVQLKCWIPRQTTLLKNDGHEMQVHCKSLSCSLGIKALQGWCMDWCCHLMWFPSKPFIKFMTVADLCYCVPLREKKKAITQLSTAVHWKVMCDVKQGEGNHVHFTTDTKGEPVVKQLIKCHSIFDSLPGWQGSILTSLRLRAWFKSHFLPALCHCLKVLVL